VLPTWQLGRRGRQECVGQDPDSRRRPPVDPDYPLKPHSVYKNDELNGPDNEESYTVPVPGSVLNPESGSRFFGNFGSGSRSKFLMCQNKIKITVDKF
jgi:hypothetical protein